MVLDSKEMASEKYKSFLPKVDESDLLNLVFDDVIDPEHNKRWKQFAATNPVLAREIIKRAYIESTMYDTDKDSTFDLHKMTIDMASFVISALETAAKRRVRAVTDVQFSDGVGGEDRPLSA